MNAIHEDGKYWVTENNGYWLVYKVEATASRKCATIGKAFGWERVLNEISRRIQTDNLSKN